MRLVFLLPFLIVFQALLVRADHEETMFIVEMEAQDVVERSKIAQLIHLDSIIGDRVFSIVHQRDLQALTKVKDLNIVSAEQIGSKGGDDYYKPFLKTLDFPPQDAAFHTYDEMITA